MLKLNAPTLLGATVLNDTQIDLAWTVNDTKQTGHRVLISTDNVTFTEKGTVLGNTATYSATGLTANTQYYFKIEAYKGSIKSLPSNAVSPKSYHAEIGVYINGLTTPLSSTQKGKLNTLVDSLKTGLTISALSDFFDGIKINAGETQESSLRNLVKNASHSTAVNSPSWVAFEGFTSNGTSSYINKNFNPATQSINVKQNDISFGVYFRVSIGSNNDMGAVDGSSIGISMGLNPNSNLSRCNSSAGSTGNTSVAGMHIVSRIISTEFNDYRNKTHITTSTQASSPLVNQNIYSLCRNTNGTASLFTTRQIAITFFAKGVNQTQVNVISDAFKAYMDSNGKGVY
jgi:hypothetical protein